MCVEDRAAFLLPEAGQDKTCQNAALKTVQRLGPSDKTVRKFGLWPNFHSSRCARTMAQRELWDAVREQLNVQKETSPSGFSQR